MKHALNEMEIMDAHVRDLIFQLERALILWVNTRDSANEEKLRESIRTDCRQLIQLENFFADSREDTKSAQQRPAEKLRKVCEALITSRSTKTPEEQQRLLVFFYSLVLQITCQIDQ